MKIIDIGIGGPINKIYAYITQNEDGNEKIMVHFNIPLVTEDEEIAKGELKTIAESLKSYTKKKILLAEFKRQE